MRNLCPKCCKNHNFTRFGLTFSFLAKRLNFQRNVIWSDAEVRMSCRSQKWKTLQPQRLITKISFDTAKTEPSEMISHILSTSLSHAAKVPRFGLPSMSAKVIIIVRFQIFVSGSLLGFSPHVLSLLFVGSQ